MSSASLEKRFEKLAKRFVELEKKLELIGRGGFEFATRQALYLNSIGSSLTVQTDIDGYGDDYPLQEMSLIINEDNRIDALTLQIGALSDEIKGITDTLSDVIVNFRDIVDVMEDNEAALLDVIDQVTDLSAVEEDLLTSADSAASTVRDILSATEDIGTLIIPYLATIPEVGPGIAAGLEGLIAGIKAANRAGLDKALKWLPKIARWGLTSVLLVRDLHVDSAIIEDIGVKEEAVKIANAGMYKEMTRSMAMIAHLHETAVVDITQYDAMLPTYATYLVPLFGVRYDKGVMDGWIGLYSNLDSKEFFNRSTVAPAHEYCVLTYPIPTDGTIERALEIIYSTGDFIAEERRPTAYEVITTGGNVKNNQKGYSIALIERKKGDKPWVVKAKSGIGTVPRHKGARLSHSGTLPIASNYALCFLDIDMEDPRNYSAHSYNCQVHVRQLLSFLVKRRKPWYWTKKHDARMLKCIKGHDFVLQGVNGPDFIMPRYGYPMGDDHSNITTNDIRQNLDEMSAFISDTHDTHVTANIDDFIDKTGLPSIDYSQLEIGDTKYHIS
jgi:hypothetical protein